MIITTKELKMLSEAGISASKAGRYIAPFMFARLECLQEIKKLRID